MSQTYTFASWNVNGLRAVLKKDPSFIQIAQELNVDILALQETKLQEGQVDIDLPGYHQTWSYAQRKGYAPARARRPSSSPKPQPRAAPARSSSTSFGLSTSIRPTPKTSSRASMYAWPGTMPIAAF